MAKSSRVRSELSPAQAWAVLAFVDAQNDRIEPALDKAYNALRYAPGNDFAATTAGHIVGWYDVRNDHEELGEGVKSQVQKVRDLADRSRAFSRGYDEAKRILTEGLPVEDGVSVPVNIVGSLEELGKQNMAIFEQAMKMFAPVAKGQNQNSSAKEEPASRDRMKDLQSKLDELQRQINDMAKK